jgi:hypothetical protein
VIDFFRDAPAGAIVLLVAGALLLAIDVPVRLRWKARVTRMPDGPVREDSRPLLPLVVGPVGWVLLIGGLAWYVLGS